MIPGLELQDLGQIWRQSVPDLIFCRKQKVPVIRNEIPKNIDELPGFRRRREGNLMPSYQQRIHIRAKAPGIFRIFDVSLDWAQEVLVGRPRTSFQAIAE